MAEDIRKLFGKNLRKIRGAQKISQEELAFRCGLHRTYVSSVERGERNISLENIQKLAEALEVSMKDLIPEE
ncbi:helix-turn-helix protein [Hydrogenispora ethanolica]|uniref:Helix-turn-helix protein n=1 Tax=Hydrogenispora ethanolica TaxID=1082276 RepID=A0A4R1RXR2_HYDET|nr:helix-turn-helix transcriptional regulator [Hydrogenispora ethanolica]TCL71545.1 helix-turn-helix protein [Hydrogenispora ethanolica]